MTTTEVKPGKTCRLCNKTLDSHSFGTGFTCRTCQHECHRAEPLCGEMAALHTKQQRENALAIKALKDEISELKNNPSNRQQKASTALKGLKDTMSDLSSEVGWIDFTRRLKEAFVAPAEPEEKQVKEQELQRGKDAKQLKDGMREMQAFLRQMQQAFSVLPVLAVPAPAQTQTEVLTTTVLSKSVATSQVKKEMRVIVIHIVACESHRFLYPSFEAAV
ncbi:uncharacterized protein SPSC_04869 [Sporisorium scitamineum]|uniref:Uncharacterized protein n=1 Tax=Sporisorium scitamineum TaxID=49012 RepID=A0A127ZG72_9BASI|nr:uncharacterized protein SPSC_04869 [Sporisorium scitamineum]